MLGTIEPTSGGNMLAFITASGSPPAKYHQSLNVITQLPDIARPIVRLQYRHCVLADAPLRQSRLLGNLVHKIVYEVGNILAPLGQRGHTDRNNRKPMIEIFAKLAFGDQRLEIARRR